MLVVNSELEDVSAALDVIVETSVDGDSDLKEPEGEFLEDDPITKVSELSSSVDSVVEKFEVEENDEEELSGRLMTRYLKII